jgi:hypothetical protein
LATRLEKVFLKAGRQLKKLCVTISIVSLLIVVVLAAPEFLSAQERRTGGIFLKCDYPGAAVFLDGEERDSRAGIIQSVPAGNHQLVVVVPGMDVYVETVRVRPGVVTKVSVKLRPLSGKVSVSTDPAGAKVLIDGREAGSSPMEIDKVARGKHTVTVLKPGFATREKEIELEYGDELSLFLRLKVKVVVFSVFSFPSGAEVFIDGKKVGTTPLKLKNITPGQHKLLVTKEEGCSHEELVTVLAGKDIALDITLPVPGAILSLDPGPAGRKLYIDGHFFTELKESKTIVPPGEHRIKIIGWKESILYRRHLKLEKGKTCRISVKPHFQFSLPLKGHEQAVLAFAFAPGSTTLASASKDGTIRLWDVSRKKELLSVDAHPSGVQAVCFDPKGKRLVSGGWDETVRIWDTSTGGKLKEFDVESSVLSVVWSSDGKYIVVGCTDGTLKLWAVKKDWKETVLRGHEGGVRSLAIMPEGDMLVSGGADGRVMFWKLSDGSQVDKLSDNTPVKAVSISGNGKFLATGGEDGQVRVRQLDSTKLACMIKAQPNWVLSLAAGWGSVFAAGGDGEKVTILDATKGKLLELKELKSQATALAFDDKGRFLAAGSSGGIIYLWIAE